MIKVITSERIPIKMWLSEIENSALEQAKNLANLPFSFKHIAIMPDSHVGFGMPIGGVMATEEVIVPNAVGVDIGCGMIAIKTSLTDIGEIELKEIMQGIRDLVPVGFSHQREDQEWDGFNEAPDIEIIQKELNNSKRQLGTLGGGNHFIEIQKGNDGFVWIMIHSGSRNFGLKTANEYHQKARKLVQKWGSSIPTDELSFLPMDTNEGKQYFEAMKYCVKFALANRALMMSNVKRVINKVLGTEKIEYTNEVNIEHNYASLENHFGKNVLVHRKGATKADIGLVGIIPGSMGTFSYIVEGLGNPDSFRSCSHGAGRRMGRKQAIRELNLEEEQKKMGNIIGKPRSQDDLDEAPGAYKPIGEVMENQKDLTKILVELKPLAVIKG